MSQIIIEKLDEMRQALEKGAIDREASGGIRISRPDGAGRMATR